MNKGKEGSKLTRGNVILTRKNHIQEIEVPTDDANPVTGLYTIKGLNWKKNGE